MKTEILYPLIGRFPISFHFGEAPDWYLKQFGYPHNGLDIACPTGSVVVATDDGIVTFADNIPDINGMGIFITHDWGQSEYWHLSKLSVRFADKIKKGDVIGFSGATGFASGPHLHFGIKVAGDSPENMRGWSNPEKYISDAPGPAFHVEPVGKTYEVVSGDTLWDIAFSFYGEGYQWPRIWEANKNVIKDPGLIMPGMILKIP
jgi:murein DD-endopeptidase MepM/ murein hydrolase activator NlpD